MLAIFVALVGSISARTPIQVEGEGYLRFVRESETVYARQAEIGWSDGRLVGPEGLPLAPLVKLEREPQALQIDLQGRISAVYTDSTIQVGRIVLAMFPDDVRPVVSGNCLRIYGDARLAEPGEGLSGVIRPWKPNESHESVVRIHPVEQSRISELQAPQNSAKPFDSSFVEAGGIEIRFSDISEVLGDSMTLADVADVFAKPGLLEKVQQVSLGNSPVFGVPRTLDRTNILAKLRGAGIDVAKVRISGPVTIKIKRIGQSVTQAMFAQCAIQSIATEYPSFKPESSRPVPDLEAPMGELQLVADRPVRSGNNLSVTVVAYVDGKRINSRTLYFSNNAAPLSIKPGDSITVVVQSRDVRVESAGKVKSIDALSGRVTIELATGKQMTGILNDEGKVVVNL